MNEMTQFDESLPMILNRCLDQVMPGYREIFAQYALTEQQWRILRILWEEKKIVSTELASRALIPAPSLVGILDRLEKKGLVARVKSMEDRRNVAIIATAAGRQLEKELRPQVDKINAHIRSRVTKEEWDAMEATLLKISTAIHSDTTVTAHSA